MTRVGDSLVDARIQFAWRAVSGGISIQAFNGTGSDVDLSAATFDIEYSV